MDTRGESLWKESGFAPSVEQILRRRSVESGWLGWWEEEEEEEEEEEDQRDKTSDPK